MGIAGEPGVLVSKTRRSQVARDRGVWRRFRGADGADLGRAVWRKRVQLTGVFWGFLGLSSLPVLISKKLLKHAYLVRQNVGFRLENGEMRLENTTYMWLVSLGVIHK